MAHISRSSFQQASGIVVSINVIHKEAHLLGFHGRASAHKFLITISNHAARLRWCKELKKWTLNELKQVLLRNESTSISWMEESGLGVYFCQNALCHSKVWQKWNYGIWMFHIVYTGTLDLNS
ncbi:hypothetical protein TNCV_3603951 [Trichonephila clavipes]|nr:hypothetical protein TNCV_3603951 [Trichonephila clavipes]